MTEFKHIVEPEPEPRKLGRDHGGRAMSMREIMEAEDAPRKRLREDLLLVRAALWVTAIMLVGGGVYEWVGWAPALAAVGTSILYALGSRKI